MMSFQQWLEHEAPKHGMLHKLLAAARVEEGEAITNQLRAKGARAILFIVFAFIGAPNASNSQAHSGAAETAGNLLEPAELKRLLDAFFNETELRDLAFQLEIDYESLPGPAKSDKTRELTAYFVRRGRASELEDIIRSLRPNAFK
jgi:hypothetical protein